MTFSMAEQFVVESNSCLFPGSSQNQERLAPWELAAGEYTCIQIEREIGENLVAFFEDSSICYWNDDIKKWEVR